MCSSFKGAGQGAPWKERELNGRERKTRRGNGKMKRKGIKKEEGHKHGTKWRDGVIDS